MKEKKEIRAGKPYEELTDKERALVVGFTSAEHAELKSTYGKRLRHVTVQVDEDERYDYLVVRPDKNLILAMAAHKDDLGAANDLLLNNCVKAGDRQALEDSAVYTTVLSAISELISGQAAFISKA